MDHVAFVMTDGTVCGFGGAGGAQRPPFVLEAGETIAAVEVTLVCPSVSPVSKPRAAVV